MRAKQIVYSVLVGCVALLVASLCLALVGIRYEGDWPDTWPKELDGLRAQARTLGVGTGIQETVYEIPFTSREEFEAAWPHILAVKSEGAPLILVKSPSKIVTISMDAGVRIYYPAMWGPDGNRFKADSPWPDDIKSESGVLPEYVANVGGKWVAADAGDALEKGFLYRARVDIELVVDGKIVDLNRIPLPADTPIIDGRFEKKTAPAD